MNVSTLTRAACVLVALVLSAGCATTHEGLRSDAEVQIIAHRGASGHAPENTVAAFERAVAMDSDWFEIDCRLSRDGAVVVCHDTDLERTTGEKHAVAGLTLAELKEFDVGSWFDASFAGERIPTLGEALAASTADCGVYVEIKSEAGDNEVSMVLVQHGAERQEMDDLLRQELQAIVAGNPCRSTDLTLACIEEIRSRGMEKRVVIQSFSPLICLVARLEAPEIRTEFLISDSEDHPERWPLLVHFAGLIGVEGINASKDSLTPERLAAFHESGKSVAVWTVNEPAELERFVAMGVDGLITNYPDRAHLVLPQPAR